MSGLAMGLAFGMIGFCLAQSGGDLAPEPKFSQLTKDDVLRLEQQRSVVAAAAKRLGLGPLTKTKTDLPILQKLIDERVFTKSQTYELQCLGVAFGDVLTNELPLQWVVVTDEYGRDPTLRYKKTTIQINALTMISKRVEGGDAVNLAELRRITREEIAKVER